jgi:hypothetical protein
MKHRRRRIDPSAARRGRDRRPFQCPQSHRYGQTDYVI